MSRAITKKMSKIEQDIESSFRTLYCKKDFTKLLYDYRKSPSDRGVHILKSLADKLRSIGVDCKYGESEKYYRELVEKLDIPSDAGESNKKIVDTLLSVFRQYPRPEEYMARIVDSIEPSDNSESLRLRILKRFLKTVNVKESGKQSKVLADIAPDLLDESVFDTYSGEAIVQGCSNLAQGRFVSPTSTKEFLFLFAFAFGMRYYLPNDEDYDEILDVEKNICADYYSDNLTRYLYTQDGGKDGSSDVEPSGIIINPKNFVDVAFVYYLNKEPDGMLPGERVRRFYSMLDRIKHYWTENVEYSEARRASYNKKPTSDFRKRLCADIFKLNDDELFEYLVSDYYCELRYPYIHKKTGETRYNTKGVFELQFETNSAYEQYDSLVKIIKSELGIPEDAVIEKPDGRKLRRSNGDSIKTFNEIYIDENTELRIMEMEVSTPVTEQLDASALKQNEEESEKLDRIIDSIEKRLDPYNALNNIDSRSITRTKLIAAYYHYYCLENEHGLDYDSEGYWTSFEDVYDHFELYLNMYLVDAGYQKISPKNLYDMFVIFFAYCKVNGFMKDDVKAQNVGEKPKKRGRKPKKANT